MRFKQSSGICLTKQFKQVNSHWLKETKQVPDDCLKRMKLEVAFELFN